MTHPTQEERFTLGRLVSQLSWVNIELWHEEDKARSPEDAVVAHAKRRIDKFNQKRNNLMEAVDALLCEQRPAQSISVKNKPAKRRTQWKP